MKTCTASANMGRLWCTLNQGHTGMHFDNGANRWFLDKWNEWHYPPGDSEGHPLWECLTRRCWD